MVQKLKEILGDERNLVYTALSFCLAYDAVTTVIPGSKNISQLQSNLESLKHPVSKELVERLEAFYRDEVKELNLPW